MATKVKEMKGPRLLPVLAAIAGLSLASCTGGDTLEPSSMSTAAASAAGSGDVPATGGADATVAGAPPPQTATAVSAARLQLAPIVGAPVEAAGPLTQGLAESARRNGMAIARGGEPASLTLKGYFSALGEGKETTVVYVWDVLDASGNRIHRIQGQQRLPGGEGWPSVTAGAMQGIAATTIDGLAAWLKSRTG